VQAIGAVSRHSCAEKLCNGSMKTEKRLAIPTASGNWHMVRAYHKEDPEGIITTLEKSALTKGRVIKTARRRIHPRMYGQCFRLAVFHIPG
jgi:hypothetical protein